MTMTDPIADMLTRIRNAQIASHEIVDIPSSKIKANIVKLLKAEGFISNYRIISENNHEKIRIFLKYDENGKSVITGLKRVSKPSCRVYQSYNDVPKVLNGYGINVVSTSKGLLTDSEVRKQKVGGEIICSVW